MWSYDANGNASTNNPDEIADFMKGLNAGAEQSQENKKDDEQSVNGNDDDPGKDEVKKHIPVPLDYKKKGLPGFPKSRLLPNKKGARTSWDLGKGKHAEWDSQHGEVEVYNKNGDHTGAFDPETGEQIKDPIKKRNPTYKFQEATSDSYNYDALRAKISELTGLTGTALTIYIIISEGSRLFPPRNAIPVP
jgi:hypothetical protein